MYYSKKFLPIFHALHEKSGAREGWSGPGTPTGTTGAPTEWKISTPGGATIALGDF